MEERLPLLGNLQYAFKKATIIQKQALIKMWFKSKLWYEEGVYRTTFLMPMFRHKALILNEKRLLVYEKPLERIGKNPVSAPGGT